MKTYIFGHKRPDTDSVCSSIAYSYLKNKLGLDTEPRVLGSLNKETKYALNYFNIKEPRYLDNLYVPIKNIDYLKNVYEDEYKSIYHVFNSMESLSITGIPIINKDHYLEGYINLKDICKYTMEGDIYFLNTSYDNILECLEGKEYLRYDISIKGRIIVANYKSNTFIDNVKLSSNDILIVADRINIIKYAIESGVKLLIIVGNSSFPEELSSLAKENKVNIIITPYTTYLTANKIKLCNYVKTILTSNKPISFYKNDLRDDFIDAASKYGHTNYPILDNDNKCLGMLRLIDQNNYHKYNVILVDHNQEEQSCDGISEANILEVIDHHNIGSIVTSIPISFRTLPVGCTSTIIYEIYCEKKVAIPQDIAGIMLSAIISDTLLLKSPTTTKYDIDAASSLAKIAKVDINEYGISLLKAGSSIKDMSCLDVINNDFKTYKVEDNNVFISQINTLDIDEIINNKKEYITLLNNMNNIYKISLFFVTDIIKEGSYLFYNEEAKDMVSKIFMLDNLEEGIFLKNIISRKKQILPNIIDYLEK